MPSLECLQSSPVVHRVYDQSFGLHVVDGNYKASSGRELETAATQRFGLMRVPRSFVRPKQICSACAKPSYAAVRKEIFGFRRWNSDFRPNSVIHGRRCFDDNNFRPGGQGQAELFGKHIDINRRWTFLSCMH